MRLIAAFLIGVILCIGKPVGSTYAQSVQILGSSALNGAINGVVLGGASMFLTDKKVNAPFNKNLDDLYALQVGLGIGTLYGVGLGGYDVVTGEGREILVSGFFNDGDNSSIIVLMDTFYGAAGGGLIAISLSLVSNDPLIDATKNGLGIGAFIGFGFGLIDTFIIADRSSEPISMNYYTPPKQADGFASISFDSGASIGLINPSIISNLEFSSNNFTQVYRPSVEFVNLRVNF